MWSYGNDYTTGVLYYDKSWQWLIGSFVDDHRITQSVHADCRFLNLCTRSESGGSILLSEVSSDVSVHMSVMAAGGGEEEEEEIDTNHSLTERT